MLYFLYSFNVHIHYVQKVFSILINKEFCIVLYMTWYMNKLIKYNCVYGIKIILDIKLNSKM